MIKCRRRDGAPTATHCAAAAHPTPLLQTQPQLHLRRRPRPPLSSMQRPAVVDALVFDHIRLKPASNKLVDRRSTGRGDGATGNGSTPRWPANRPKQARSLSWRAPCPNLTSSPAAAGHEKIKHHRERPQHFLMWQNVQTQQYAAEILRTHRIRRCRIKRPGRRSSVVLAGEGR